MKAIKVEDVVSETPETKDVAFGISRDLDGNWKLVTIKYDLPTGTVATPEAIRSDSDKGVIVEAFKIEVINAEIFN